MPRFAKYFAFFLALSTFLYFSLFLPQTRQFFTTHAFSTLSELFLKQSVKNARFEIQGNNVEVHDVELGSVVTSNHTLVSFWLSLLELWLVDINHVAIHQLSLPTYQASLSCSIHCDSSSLRIDSLYIQKGEHCLSLNSTFKKEGGFLHVFGNGSFLESKSFPNFTFEMHWEPVSSFYAPIFCEIKDRLSLPFSGGQVIIDEFQAPLKIILNEKQELNISGDVAKAWVEMPKEDITIGPISGHFDWNPHELEVRNIVTTFNDVSICLEYRQSKSHSTITCNSAKGSLGDFQSLLNRWYPGSFLRHIPGEGYLMQTEPLVWESSPPLGWTLQSSQFFGRIQDAGVIISPSFLLDALNCDLTYAFESDHLTIDGLEGCLLLSEPDAAEYLVYADTLTFSPIALTPFPFDVWFVDDKKQLARFKGEAKVIDDSLVLDCIPKWTHLGPYYLDEARFSFKEKTLMDTLHIKGRADAALFLEFVRSLPMGAFKDKRLQPLKLTGDLDITLDWNSENKSTLAEVSSESLLLQGKALQPFHLKALRTHHTWQIDDLSWNDWSLSGEVIASGNAWKIPAIAVQTQELFIGGKGLFYPLDNRFSFDHVFMRIPSIDARFDATKTIEFEYYLHLPHLITNLTVEGFNIQSVSFDKKDKLLNLRNIKTGLTYISSLDLDLKSNLEGLASLEFNWKTVAPQKPKSLEFLPWDFESILPRKAAISFHLVKDGIVWDKLDGCESDGGFLHYQLDPSLKSKSLWNEGLSIFGQMVFHHPTLKKKDPTPFTIQGNWENPLWKWK